MTKEQMRIAIAELCGWKLGKPVYGHDGCWRRRAYRDLSIEIDSSWAGEPVNVIDDWDQTPNYPEDLNVCAKMEAFLIEENCEVARYLNELDLIIDARRKPVNGVHSCLSIAFATAEQRCRAFLKVKGKL